MKFTHKRKTKMKTRQGFVSNSSSTSFCIYGIELDESEQIDLSVKLEVDPYDLDNRLEEMGFNTHPYDQYSDTLVIGLSMNKMRGDETRDEFEARVENMFIDIVDKPKCGLIENGYYDG